MVLESSPRQTVLNKIIGSIKSSPMEVRIMITRYINMAVVINNVNKDQSYYLYNGSKFTYEGKQQMVSDISELTEENCYFYSAYLVSKSSKLNVYNVCVAYDRTEADEVYFAEEELDYARMRLRHAQSQEPKVALGNLDALRELKRRLEEQA